METIDQTLKKAKEARINLTLASDEQINAVIESLARLTDESHSLLLDANRLDLEKMEKTNPLYDRLLLNDKRLDEIASALRFVASLNCPLGEIIEERTLPNDVLLKKIRVEFGVVGIIYEARPNVTFDVFALCLKSGNIAVLKGGKDADNTNKAIISLIREALTLNNLPEECCTLLPSTHESTLALLNAVGNVDVCIPRGGKKLIDYVRENAKIPVIETGAGVVHTYFDKDGDVSKGEKIIENGKTRRVSVCNALDTLLINKQRLTDLPVLVKPLAEKRVIIHADAEGFKALENNYPADLLVNAKEADALKEWMDYQMGIFTVDSWEEAVKHISKYGSGHSESIITENEDTAKNFCSLVDAACVYVNLPTSFTDGGEFGLGAEIGISTQKLGPRGPMGLKEITTYKYILSGKGQIRK